MMKFGGASVADAACIAHVAEIIQGYLKQGHEVVAVVSALAGVTDELIAVANRARQGDLDGVTAGVKALGERHRATVQGAVESPEARRETLEVTERLLQELGMVLTGIAYLGELTAKSRDYVLSFGERLSTPILAGALTSRGVKSQPLTGGEAGIVTDSSYGEARPLLEVTRHRARLKLKPLLEEGVTPVVTGFIAASQEGAVTTLGRGGSDYTATILGAALDADEVWLWTDVDGIMTADPKLVPSARTIPALSFQEAAEMAIFGVKRMHPRALEPAMEYGIPVRVRNTFNAANEGTLIAAEERVRSDGVVKALTLIGNVALVTVNGFGMVGTPGTAAKVFSALGSHGVNVLMISQSSSEANISFIVTRDQLGRAVNALETSLLGGGLIRDVTMEEDVAIIAAIGAGMKGTPGVAARLFTAVARRGINVRMIAQGSSELNISFVVKESDGPQALNALHEEFALSSLR
ncbi:MAG: aspartate kinase [Candidatus Bathyarchaeia archaeon]